MAIKLFGFTLGKKDVVERQPESQQSFALPTEALDDGAVTVTSNAYYGTYVDLEGSVRNEIELITRYREMSNHPEMDQAIEDIVNEAISRDALGEIVDLNIDKLELSESVKDKFVEEFNNIKNLLNFNKLAEDLFRRWYIDGRLFYHIVVDKTNPKKGIQELRYIDPRKIRKVREIQTDKDVTTGAMLIKSIAEYYVYTEAGTTTQTYTANINSGVRIAADSILSITSGLMDAKNTVVISYLHSSIKPLNQLRMIEDAIVIYRISRAPERRVFYIDVGNLPKGKAEQYMRDIMIKFKNTMVYDSVVGELKDSRRHMSMLEDFWMPRREGGKGTEIITLPSGSNLAETADLDYFRKNLLQSLHVPVSRLEPQQGGMIGLGRTTEVTRDEVKFAKFTDKLRNRFSHILLDALKVQLSLKNICSLDEWESFKDDIHLNYRKDNNFAELKDAELLKERLSTLNIIDPYIGKYYSTEWVRRNILMQTNEEMEEMNKQMKSEEKDGITSLTQDQRDVELYLSTGGEVGKPDVSELEPNKEKLNS